MIRAMHTVRAVPPSERESIPVEAPPGEHLAA